MNKHQDTPTIKRGVSWCLFNVMKWRKFVCVTILFGRYVFFNELSWGDSHIFLELSTKEIHIGKIAKLGNLCDSISFKAQQITCVVDFELNDIFLRRNSVYFLEQLLKIGHTHFA